MATLTQEHGSNSSQSGGEASAIVPDDFALLILCTGKQTWDIFSPECQHLSHGPFGVQQEDSWRGGPLAPYSGSHSGDRSGPSEPLEPALVSVSVASPALKHSEIN